MSSRQIIVRVFYHSRLSCWTYIAYRGSGGIIRRGGASLTKVGAISSARRDFLGHRLLVI